MEEEKDIHELLQDIVKSIKAYNLKAKDINDFSRIAYVVNDLNWSIKRAKLEPEADWVPEERLVYERSYSVNDPEAEGWFPSSFCIG